MTTMCVTVFVPLGPPTPSMESKALSPSPKLSKQLGKTTTEKKNCIVVSFATVLVRDPGPGQLFSQPKFGLLYC